MISLEFMMAQEQAVLCWALILEMLLHLLSQRLQAVCSCVGLAIRVLLSRVLMLLGVPSPTLPHRPIHQPLLQRSQAHLLELGHLPIHRLIPPHLLHPTQGHLPIRLQIQIRPLIQIRPRIQIRPLPPSPHL